MITFRELDEQDLRWGFDSSELSCAVGSRWVKLDPFPGYAHDVGLVMGMAAELEAAFRPAYDIVVHVARHEDLSRTNGCSFDERVVDPTNPKQPWQDRPRRGHIFLCGKRTPPHPAVTRYLVAHEYGHHVETWVEAARGLDEERRELAKEYMALRGLETLVASGGRWHAAAEEIFACDFRVLVAGVEMEYWPHPGIARPESAPEAVTWWDATLRWWRERGERG